MEILHPLWAEINLDNFIYNINNIKSKLPSSNLIGVVKANAYGHGAVEISKVYLELGISNLAVANISEAIELRSNNISCPIQILGASLDNTIDAIVNYDIEPTITNYNFAKNLNDFAKSKNKIINIHIAVDTGMGRIGFLKNESSINEIKQISSLSNLNISSLFSHFATADSSNKEYAQQQLNNYLWFCTKLDEASINYNFKSLSNSAAIIDLPNASFDLVRPGIIQYGYCPSNEVNISSIDLKPVLTWKTRIIHIKEVEANTYIGYGQNFKTSRKSRIATLPVGYADGYSRDLSNKSKVIINGKFAPLIGNVCMDQIMIDVTDLPNINLNAEVILLGSEGNCKFDADDIATLTNTISYEVLCAIGRRVTRVYIRDQKIINIQIQY